MIKKIIYATISAIIIIVIMIIFNIHIFPKLVMQISIKKYGNIESCIKIEDKNHIHYISKTKSKLVSTSFKRVYGLFWSEKVKRIYSINDLYDNQVNIKYLSTSLSEESVIYGLCNDTDILLLKFELVDGSMKEIYFDDTNLFAFEINGKVDEVKGYDDKGNLIYLRNIQDTLE